MDAQRGLPPTRRLAAVLLTVGLLVAAGCTPWAAVSEAAVSDPVLVAAGDIACDPADPHFLEDGGNYCEQNLTADLVESQNPSTVAAAGDLQYESGTLSAFQASYDPTWGRFKGITRPSVGNHEYMTVNAQGYRDYWANRGGADLAYAYNLGTWRIYVLNSNCAELAKPGVAGSCSSQADWLRRDQAANPRKCVLAYWHHALRSTSTEHPTNTAVRPFWKALYDYRADVVVTGHGHISAVWEKLDPYGTRSTRGIKAFEAGAGGRSHHTLAPFDDRIEGTKRFNDAFAVLRLELHPGSYSYRFVTPAGDRFGDSRACV
jgi:acid phosphatase type 7